MFIKIICSILAANYLRLLQILHVFPESVGQTRTFSRVVRDQTKAASVKQKFQFATSCQNGHIRWTSVIIAVPTFFDETRHSVARSCLKNMNSLHLTQCNPNYFKQSNFDSFMFKMKKVNI